MKKSRPTKKANADHGEDVRLINDKLLGGWPLPRPDDKGDKETRGVALIIAGTGGMPGTAILAATAALRVGAGKVQVAAPECVAPWIAVSVPETLVLSLPETSKGQLIKTAIRKIAKPVSRASAILIGPGMSGGSGLTQLTRDVAKSLSEETCLILDAEAMMCVTKKSTLADFRGSVIVTPHAGEMAKLSGCTKEVVNADPLKCAREFAKSNNVIVVMKGSPTYIVEPSGRAHRSEAGNIGLATSGSGDTLAGFLVGLCARGADPVQAAVYGVTLHAKAGEILSQKIGPLGFLARELAAEVPALLAKYEAG